jgi:hypothetical protein
MTRLDLRCRLLGFCVPRSMAETLAMLSGYDLNDLAVLVQRLMAPRG